MQLDLFRGVVHFAAVAEAGSIRGAATRLGISPTAVSKALSALEAELGMALVRRDARGLALTAEGERFYEHCRPAIAAISAGRSAMEAAQEEPQGELSLSVPYAVAGLVLPALADLRARHPRLRFRVAVTDQLARLTEDPVDVAVRVGPLPDSSLVARRLYTTRLLTVASPAYLARAGVPATKADLALHDCLSLIGPGGRPYAWRLASGPVVVEARLLVDHAPSLVDAALAGLGITQLFDLLARPLLRDGRLVAVLPEEVAEGPEVHAVCAPGGKGTPRVRAAFEAFVGLFDRLR